MQNWHDFLSGDPLAWLLGSENPSVRYWTLVDILGGSAADPEVGEAGGAVARQPLVRELFALRVLIASTAT